jgi:hypothetical protein
MDPQSAFLQLRLVESESEVSLVVQHGGLHALETPAEAEPMLDRIRAQAMALTAPIRLHPNILFHQ